MMMFVLLVFDFSDGSKKMVQNSAKITKSKIIDAQNLNHSIQCDFS